jgi:hypothetical protein
MLMSFLMEPPLGDLRHAEALDGFERSLPGALRG